MWIDVSQRGWIALLLILFHMTDAANELIELSYTFNVDAPMSPKLSPFEHKIIKKGTNKFNLWVELNDFCTSEHAGTHLDAPVHFSKDKWSVDDIPIDRLFRVPAVMINLSEKSKKMPNYGIKPSDLEGWEKLYGVIPDGTVLLIQTGWGRKSANIDAFSGLDEYDKLNFPGLSEEAARWITTHGTRHNHKKGIIGVGIDTMSLDVGQSVKYPAHVTIFKQNIYGLETIANMDKLPATGFLLTIMPVRIGGGSGSPARIVAEITGDAEYSRADRSDVGSGLLIAVLLTVSYIFSSILL